MHVYLKKTEGMTLWMCTTCGTSLIETDGVVAPHYCPNDPSPVTAAQVREIVREEIASALTVAWLQSQHMMKPEEVEDWKDAQAQG